MALGAVQDAEVVEEKDEGELDRAAVDAVAEDEGRGAMRLAMRVSGHIAYGYQVHHSPTTTPWRDHSLRGPFPSDDPQVDFSIACAPLSA